MNTWLYMLDTNAASDLIRFPSGKIAQRIATVGPSRCCISALVASELRYGVEKKASPRLAELVENLLARLTILPYEAISTPHYARIRHNLTSKGGLIGPVDLLIAAHARSLGLTLVTNNVREFSRVEGLQVENWIEDRP